LELIILFNSTVKQISQIAVGLDIWDDTCTTDKDARLLRSSALQSFAAHASTQHNNERLVKLGALMLSAGKGEIMVSIFAIASNDFITEHHDKDKQKDTHPEVPANQPVVATDIPKRPNAGKIKARRSCWT
jgi:hypothetical protein